MDGIKIIKAGEEVRVSKLPTCDVHKYDGTGEHEAQYDAAVTYNGNRRQWGFVCQKAFDAGDGKLGVGRGQRLVLDDSKVATDSREIDCDEFNENGSCIHSDHMMQAGL